MKICKTDIYIKPKILQKRFHQRICLGKNITTRTLDNGGRPYKIVIKPLATNDIKITISKDMNYEDFEKEPKFEKIMVIENADEIWYGSGCYDDELDPNKNYFGNTVLIVIGKKCISISNRIFTFLLLPEENVIDYVSTVGNSSVPYGFITTDNGIYALPGFNCVESLVFIEKIVKFPLTLTQRKDYLKNMCMPDDGSSMRQHNNVT